MSSVFGLGIIEIAAVKDFVQKEWPLSRELKTSTRGDKKVRKHFVVCPREAARTWPFVKFQ